MSACASLKDSSYRYKELDITHGTNWRYQRSAAGRFVSENFSISSTAFYTRRAVNGKIFYINNMVAASLERLEELLCMR